MSQMAAAGSGPTRDRRSSKIGEEQGGKKGIEKVEKKGSNKEKENKFDIDDPVGGSKRPSALL